MIFVDIPDVIMDIPIQPQRQDALTHQLIDLVVAADRLGMRDAADWINRGLAFGDKPEGR
jgi:hypothetical protein